MRSKAFSTLAGSAYPFSSSPAPSNIDVAISNPLSLNDDKIRQYRAAGLELDQELPSKSYTGFPHRNLPAGFEEDGIRDEDGEKREDEGGEAEEERGSRGSFLKIRHLGVLTAIVQRCLLEGDIARASKAWALLMRTQVGGKGVDLRTTSYWGIGAELLIRSGQQRPTGKKSLSNDLDEDINEGTDNTQEGDEEATAVQGARTNIEDIRWGTPAGFENAKDYYARLILQHPYKRQFSTYTSALDFWPAMLSCEIYGIQASHATSLLELNSQAEDEDSDNESSDRVDSIEEAEDGDDDEFTASPNNSREESYFVRRTRREARQERRRRERLWEKKEEVRKRAVVATERLAGRMDELMTGPPWSDSAVLQRLRGCVALWIGDLTMPTPWEGVGEEDDDDDRRDRRESADRMRELEMERGKWPGRR